jgi:hypothetical protein
MYDFYGNPPETKEQIREYITTWLAPTNDTTTYSIGNEKFICEQGFIRAFYAHSVFRNIDTNEYAWYTYPREQIGEFEDFPEKRYSNFEDLINGTVDDYYVQWKLTK